jgi:acyl-coenzyme A thioesterase PaaI-like protein
MLIGNQRLPAIHGGMVGSFLEMAAIAALVHRLGSDRIPKPINFNVNYLRTAGPADCSATTEVVKLGRRIAHVRVVGWQDDPKRPFASGYGSFLV